MKKGPLSAPAARTWAGLALASLLASSSLLADVKVSLASVAEAGTQVRITLAADGLEEFPNAQWHARAPEPVAT